MTVNVQKRRRYKICRAPAGSYRGNGISRAKQLFILLTFIAASGVLAGAFSRIYNDGYQLSFSELSFKDTFIRSLISVWMYVFVCFLSGFSSVGQPVGYILCLFKGTGTGWLAADVLLQKPCELTELLGILPFEAMSMVAVILAARENIRMSALTAARTFGKAESSSDGAFRLYLIKFLIILLISAAAAILDAAVVFL